MNMTANAPLRLENEVKKNIKLMAGKMFERIPKSLCLLTPNDLATVLALIFFYILWAVLLILKLTFNNIKTDLYSRQ